MNRPSALMTSARFSQRVITSRPVSWLRLYFAIIVIASAFAWSIYRIVTTRVQESPPGTITIRMVHWQLEAGVREAIAKMGEKYTQLHPNVRIVQEAVPEPVYATWLTTNLLGGTAPDLVEVPFGHMPEEIVRQFHNRYFVPLTPYIGRPNPYNKGTELEGKPLRATFKDGMRLAYVKEIQEYMVMPLSLFGTRMFYNKDLLKKLTGLDKPPLEYRAFIKACEKIASQSDAEGNRYSPIASSKDHFWAWDGMMFNPLTYPLLRKIDFDRDGKVSADEAFAGFKSGRVDFNSPPYKARYKMMREVCNFCQPGYTGVALQDAVFLFAQQRAVFLATGTWDARSMQDQVGSEFEMAISEFPVPSRDDPDYGQFSEGPVYEEPERGFPFAITRQSEHQEEVLDFLFFLASQKYNQEMNQIMGWMPVIHGAKMDDFLKPFEPHLEGVYSCLMPAAGSETRNKYQQVYSLYQANQISYEQFIAQFEPFYKERGLEDFGETKRDWQRATHEDEQRLMTLRSDALRANNDSAGAKWQRYRVVMQTRQLLPAIEHSQQIQLIDKGTETNALGPYEYSADALKSVKERVRNGK